MLLHTFAPVKTQAPRLFGPMERAYFLGQKDPNIFICESDRLETIEL